VLMKDNSAAIVIEVGAANFGLLSEDEQAGMVAAYSSLLNSLSFPVQILILSKKIDVSNYLNYLDLKIVKQQDTGLKDRLKSYKEFIKSTIKKNSVLERRFFFVVPFSSLEMGTALAGKQVEPDYVVTRAKTSLYPKRDNLLRLLAKIGLRAQVLGQQALVDLFYNLYNPSATGRAIGDIDAYTDVILTG